jgi:hypothetical protein
VRLFDGSTVVLSLKVKAKISHTKEVPKAAESSPVFERRDAAVLQQDSILLGLTVSGTYHCNLSALATLVERWGIEDGLLPTVLSWESYLVGMELPGESALFSRFVLQFDETPPVSTTMTYKASVASVDAGFGLVETEVSLFAGGFAIASGQCWSYIRPPVPELEMINSEGVRPDSLAGRVAVIVGSSRGFGAAIERALELRGARRDRLPPAAVERLETIAGLAVRLRETVRRLSNARDEHHEHAGHV